MSRQGNAMTSIEVPDWVVEVAARVVAKNVGEDYDSLGPFTQDTIKATQRECITAVLGAWVVPVGRLNDSSPTLYTLRQEKPE